ncbi:MAG: PAS domain-containing protein [Cyanobacteria bacterium RI_101]|nr:PAS domain-containing protein [Cyanobacteria bacterium RI_101]
MFYLPVPSSMALNAYIPHGHCYLWQTPLVWLHLTSDFLTALAYYSIPLTLLYFLRKRQDIPFSNIIILFSAFILCCGATHILEIVTLWYPIYWVSGAVKALTAIVSVITAVELVHIIPQALSLKSPKELAALNQELNQQMEERQAAESALQELNATLEERVEKRTHELAQMNQDFKREIEDRKRAQNFIKRIIDITPNVLKIYDFKSCQMIYTNRNLASVLGYPSQDVEALENALVPSYVNPEDALRVKKTLENISALEDGQYLDLDYRVKTSAGTLRWLSQRSAIFEREEDGQIKQVISICEDITERVQVEAALRESQYFIEQVVNSSPQILYILDPITWKNVYINRQSLEILGYPPQQFQAEGSQFLAQILHPEDLPLIRKNKDFWQTARDGEVLTTEYRMRHQNGAWRWLRSREVVFARNEENQVVKVLGTAQDISDSKVQEQKLYEQGRRESLLREITQRILQSLELPIIFNTVVQEIRHFLQADRVAIFQFEPESFFEQGTIVAESVVQPFTSALNSVLEESCFSRNYALKYQEGRIQSVSDIYQSDLLPCHIEFLAQFQVRANLVLPLISNHSLWGLLCIHQCSQARTWQETEVNLLKQITNQFEIAIQKASLYKQAQQELAEKQKLFLQLTNELEQKKILLKEIHHRVKNNLQIMSSLLYLQFSKASPEIQQLSEDYQNRIQSMALIHEQLYRSEDLANINFEQYLKNLTYHIFQSYGVEPGAITLTLRVNSLTVPLEQSIPLGLIVQELVSNALKHAFPQGAGEITIELTPQAEALCLTVADNGVGIPPELDLANTDSLGLQLIYSLTEQLQGELAYATADGCQFQIIFSTGY